MDSKSSTALNWKQPAIKYYMNKKTAVTPTSHRSIIGGWLWNKDRGQGGDLGQVPNRQQYPLYPSWLYYPSLYSVMPQWMMNNIISLLIINNNNNAQKALHL